MTAYTCITMQGGFYPDIKTKGKRAIFASTNSGKQSDINNLDLAPLNLTLFSERGRGSLCRVSWREVQKKKNEYK